MSNDKEIQRLADDGCPHIEPEDVKPNHVVIELPPVSTWAILDKNNPPEGWSQADIEWILSTPIEPEPDRHHDLGGEG